LKRVLIEAVLLIVVVMVLVVQDCRVVKRVSIVLTAELSIVVVAAVLS